MGCIETSQEEDGLLRGKKRTHDTENIHWTSLSQEIHSERVILIGADIEKQIFKQRTERKAQGLYSGSDGIKCINIFTYEATSA